MWSSKNRSPNTNHRLRQRFRGNFIFFGGIPIHTTEMGGLEKLPLTDALEKMYERGWFGTPNRECIWSAVVAEDFELDFNVDSVSARTSSDLVNEIAKEYRDIHTQMQILVAKGTFTDKHRRILMEKSAELKAAQAISGVT